MSKEKFNIGTNLDNVNKVELTKQGKNDLETKLEELIEVSRPEVQKELAEARAQGDLSENAEYDAAKDKQAEIEAEISRIEDLLTRAVIIKESKDDSTVHIGALVTYTDGKEEKSITIVPAADEFNPLEDNKVASNTPFASAILGTKVGDEVLINVDKKYKVTIKKIQS